MPYVTLCHPQHKSHHTMNYSLEIIVLFISLISLIVFYVITTSRPKSKSPAGEAPELGGAWPIIGHLHLLGGGDQLLHRTLGAMADKYGPAFNIRLGTRRAFVVSSWEVAKDCFTINDKALASRPKTAAVKHMGYNYAVFGFAPYTPFWREMRKIATLELLSTRRLEMFKDVRRSEINSGINELYGRWMENSGRPVLVEMNKWLEHMMLNIVVMMVAGKRYFGAGGGGDEAEQCQKAISEFFRLIGIFVVSDAIPCLWWLDLHGYEKEMKKTAKDLDLVLGGWLEEHRQKRKLDLKHDKDNVKDFIDVMLSLEEEGQLSNMEHDSDTSIKSTCLALILGGSDTTSGTLTWAISLLLNHPEALKKLQNELDTIVGKDRQVDESDITNLVFLQAVIKETLRLYPAGPLLGPREAAEDCTVAGYNVKAGTQLIVNIWKLQRDETVWSDPSAFQPRRFMAGSDHEQVDLRGQQFVLMPFGTGRRSCPGFNFGLQVLHLTLARLVHSFDISSPGGLQVDMTESPGMTIPKKKPLEVILTPRLPSKLYG
ncbi:xanthotoxin 5-hydroxylase CYP82C4-like [Bidens hawaiensis]|uniref:xanthotoxin 5-hydroxylase CYP82C4-like n=1 Tax=Bidens hawaiensis TaxID=980011 RepID=UPI00404B5540